MSIYNQVNKPVLRQPLEPDQFTIWSFSQNVCDAGLEPSTGAIGCPYDNAVVEAFWGRMQVELLNHKPSKTHIELASAIHDYIEPSTTPDAATQPSACSPQPSTKTATSTPTTPPDSRTRTPENRGQITCPRKRENSKTHAATVVCGGLPLVMSLFESSAAATNSSESGSSPVTLR
jgi:hypothetical protein